MEASGDYSAAKDQFLRNLGRNVLHFQQVEQMLKFVLRKGSFEGTFSQLKRLAEGARDVDKRSMGQLIAPFIGTHLSSPESSPVHPPEITEPYISFSFSIKLPDERRVDLQRQLKALVAERNQLIHHSLTEYRIDSADGCLAATAKLEEQCERIAGVRGQLSEIIKIMLETNEKFVAELKRHGPSILGGSK